jgi:hypothetical protein
MCICNTHFYIRPWLLMEYTTSQYPHARLINTLCMESRLVILTCQTNNNTKNANVPLAISTCQLFKSTLDMGPNCTIPTYQL